VPIQLKIKTTIKPVQKEFNAFRRKFPKEADKSVSNTVDQGIKILEKTTPKDTGATAKKWRKRKIRNGLWEIFNLNENIANWLEFGTKGHGPKTAPFLVFKPKGLDHLIRTKFVKGIKAVHMVRNLTSFLNRTLKENINKAIKIANPFFTR